jgi:CTP synthase
MSDEKLGDLKGILVAPGFGHRGIDGKILACKYAREKGCAVFWYLPWYAVCSY